LKRSAQNQTQVSRILGTEFILDLLKGLDINRHDMVWATDITYIPIRRRFMNLVAIMDWHSRKVLSWRISNTLDSEFCVSALEEAIARYGSPEIFNTDQGSQFTSMVFTNVLKISRYQNQHGWPSAGVWTTSLWNVSGGR
jgi:transposase InsO family protein